MSNPFKTYDYDLILVILKNFSGPKVSPEKFINIFATYYREKIIQYNVNNDFISIQVVYKDKTQIINTCNFVLNTLPQRNLLSATPQSYKKFVNKYNSKIIIESRNNQVCGCDTNCTTDNTKLIRLNELYQTYSTVYDIINDKFLCINVNELIQPKNHYKEFCYQRYVSLTSQLITAYSKYNIVYMEHITKVGEHNENKIKELNILNLIKTKNNKIQLNINNIRNNIGNNENNNDDIKTQMLLEVQLYKELSELPKAIWINDINRKFLPLLQHQLQDIIKLCFEISNICQ